MNGRLVCSNTEIDIEYVNTSQYDEQRVGDINQASERTFDMFGKYDRK